MTSDLISRQAALDIINAELNGWLTDDERLHLEGVGTGIECLPAVDPVKHGKWEFEPGYMYCSRCGWMFSYEAGLEEEWDFCPHCGARTDEPKTISAEFAKLMTEGEIQVRWKKRETD